MKTHRGLLFTALAGGVVFLLGLYADPGSVWAGYLMGFVYFVGLALTGALFLAIARLSNARWATALLPIPEALSAAIPWAGFMGFVLLLGGTHSLYEWSHDAVVAEDALLRHKAPYLNFLGVALRMLVYFVLWTFLARRMVAVSRRYEAQPTDELRRSSIRVSAIFMAVFAATFSLASVDWIQSLEPHWFSTIYALVVLSGAACAGVAFCIVVAVALARAGPLRGVLTKDHLDDLGKIAIGLSLFWAYIWYCQYMLIWYANLPEETGYFLLRGEGAWRILTQVNLVVNWAVPFLVLMPKRARRSEAVLVRVAVLMLLGHALDLYLLIAPPLMGESPVVDLWTIGPLVGAVALLFLVTLRGLGRGAGEGEARVLAT